MSYLFGVMWAGLLLTQAAPEAQAPASGARVPSAMAPHAVPGASALTPSPQAALPVSPQGTSGLAPADIPDEPHAAYEVGAYQRALEGFVDAQVEHPQDPYILYNIGTTQYKIGDYAAARKAFEQVVLQAPDLRQRVRYNLGNVAYREGKLDEAVKHYQSALELDATDQNAKFNLEFVREEIKRRMEESKKRQQEQQEKNQQSGDEQDNSQNENQDSSGKQGANPSQSDKEQGPDADNDGLSDATEAGAQNPTDPQNDDTDGDGLKDGLEDQNHNGKVDEGETDPNNKDSDGDGVSDGEDRRPLDPQNEKQDGGQASEQPSGKRGEMSEDEAARLLRALKDNKPGRRPQGKAKFRRGRSGKDW